MSRIWPSTSGAPWSAAEKGVGQFQLSWNVKPLQSQIIIQGTRGVLRVDLFLMFQARRALTPLPKAAERIINAMTDSLKPMIDVPRGVWGFLRKKVLPVSRPAGPGRGVLSITGRRHRAAGFGG